MYLSLWDLKGVSKFETKHLLYHFSYIDTFPDGQKVEMYTFSCIYTFPDGQKMERIHGEVFENIKINAMFLFSFEGNQIGIATNATLPSIINKDNSQQVIVYASMHLFCFLHKRMPNI